MRELQQQAVIISLIEALKKAESWCGETHVQKCAQFLQEGLGVPLGFEFILYKHGRFSFDLRQLLGTMRANLVIEVKSKPDPYGPSLEPGPSARVLKARFPQTTKRYRSQVRYIAQKLGTKDVVELERLSTALHVRNESPALSADARARRITELKPHIREHSASAAVDETDKILAQAPKLDS